MIYAAPGAAGAKIEYKKQYDNFIGGKWTAPLKGQYFDVFAVEKEVFLIHREYPTLPWPIAAEMT